MAWINPTNHTAQCNEEQNFIARLQREGAGRMVILRPFNFLPCGTTPAIG
jgi:hypothetical protein